MSYLPFPPGQHRRLHATQTITMPEGETADIDALMVPLLQAMWPSYRTLGSCQDAGGGRALIVMPKDDGYRLLLALVNISQPGQYDGWADEDDPHDPEVIHIRFPKNEIALATQIMVRRMASYGRR